MSLISKFTDAIKSPTGMAIVAIGSVALAVYQGFFYERRGEIVVSVDAVSRVFDVHQSVGRLQISYAGQDLRAARKGLWTISLTVSNSGNAEVKKVDFDDAAPFGLKFGGAEVVETPSVKSSVPYLNENLKIHAVGDAVFLRPVIWEAGDSVQVGVVLLGAENVRPTVSSVGKIAGMKAIGVVEAEKTAREQSVWSLIFEGDRIWVYPARAIAYFFVAIFAFAFSFAPVVWVSAAWGALRERSEKEKRRKEIAKLIGAQPSSAAMAALLSLYADAGPEVLKSIARYEIRFRKRKEIAEALGDRAEPSVIREIIRTMQPIYERAPTFTQMKNMELLVGESPLYSLADGVSAANQEIAAKLNIDLPETDVDDEYELKRGYPYTLTIPPTFASSKVD